jgi:hypothetical protein
LYAFWFPINKNSLSFALLYRKIVYYYFLQKIKILKMNMLNANAAFKKRSHAELTVPQKQEKISETYTKRTNRKIFSRVQN